MLQFSVVTIFPGVTMTSKGEPTSALKEGEWPFEEDFVVGLHSRINRFYGTSRSPVQLKSWPCP